jgi:hypothetical protein
MNFKPSALILWILAVVMLCSSQVFAETTQPEVVPREEGAFKYRPMPTVPRGAIVKNTFVEQLPKVCAILTENAAQLNEGWAALKQVGSPDKIAELSAHLEDAKNELATKRSTLERARPEARFEAEGNVKAAEDAAEEAASLVQTALAWGVLAPRLTALESDATLLSGACKSLQTKAGLEGTQWKLLEKIAIDGTLLDFLEAWQANDFAVEAIDPDDLATGKSASAFGLLGTSGATLGNSLIQGLSEFLARRAKAESLAFVRDQLTSKVCKEEGRELFAATCSTIDALADNQSLESIGVQLKAAVITDLKALPDSSLAYAAYAEPTNREIVEVTSIGRVGYRIVHEVAKGRHAAEVLANLGRIDTANLDEGFRTSNSWKWARRTSAVTHALVQIDPQSNSWLKTVRDANPKWLTASVAAALALANTHLSTESGFTLVEVNRALEFRLHLLDGILAVEDASVGLESALKSNVDDRSEEDRKRLVADALRSITAGIAVQLNVFSALDSKLASLASTVQASGDATSYVLYGDYGAAAVSVLTWLDGVIASAESASQTPEAKAKVLRLKRVRSFLGLAVEIASAKDSAGVAAALDTYAAPVGTSRVKYRRPMIALGALVGVHGGAEWLHAGSGTTTVFGAEGFIAGYAPVGVTLSRQLGAEDQKNLFHLGAMVSLLDLGALTTYRLGSELSGAAGASTEQAPEVSFAQVFSPGAFVLVGLFGSPVIVGGGVSFSPELRKVTGAGPTELAASSVRLGAFLAVDVPIFPLN